MNTLTLGYVRVSTRDQKLSIEAQAENLKRAAMLHNLGEIHIYREPATCGDTEFAKRPEASKLLTCIDAFRACHPESGEQAVTLIVPKVDRLGRDTVDVSNTARMLESKSVRILFLDINVDTSTAMGRAFMQIAAVFAELELARIRERIMEALDHKREQGELTGTVPYGWNAEETGGTTKTGARIRILVDNPVEQGWLKHMYRLRMSGWGYHSIANDLNERGVPTKRPKGTIMSLRTSESFRRKNPGEGEVTKKFVSGKWQSGNVRNVLMNRTAQDWLIEHGELPVAAA